MIVRALLLLLLLAEPPAPLVAVPDVVPHDLRRFPYCEDYACRALVDIDRQLANLARMRREECPPALWWQITDDWYDRAEMELTERRWAWRCLKGALEDRRRGHLDDCRDWLILLQKELSPADWLSGTLPDPVPRWCVPERE